MISAGRPDLAHVNTFGAVIRSLARRTWVVA
jgi:hypothetical protein